MTMTMTIQVIHTVGAVGRVEWRDLGGHNYSGVFKGAQHGLVRWFQIHVNSQMIWGFQHRNIPFLQAISGTGAWHWKAEHCTWNGPQIPEGRGGLCQPGGHVLRRRAGVLELLQERLLQPYSRVRHDNDIIKWWSRKQWSMMMKEMMMMPLTWWI